MLVWRDIPPGVCVCSFVIRISLYADFARRSRTQTAEVSRRTPTLFRGTSRSRSLPIAREGDEAPRPATVSPSCHSSSPETSPAQVRCRRQSAPNDDFFHHRHRPYGKSAPEDAQMFIDVSMPCSAESPALKRQALSIPAFVAHIEERRLRAVDAASSFAQKILACSALLGGHFVFRK